MATSSSFYTNRTAQAISVMVVSLLVGLFAALTIFVVWILSTSYSTMPAPHRIVFGASIVMFIISVIHLGLVMREATVDHVPLAISQTEIVLSMFQYVIGDLVLIWRVWVIWARKYFVVSVPLVLVTVAAAFTLRLLSSHESNTYFTSVPVVLIVANTSLCTLLITGRIWHMHRKFRYEATGSDAPSRYKGVITLIVESGMLYAACQVVSLILYYTDSIGLPIVLNLEIPLIGILPTLIIVFVHLDMVLGPHPLKAREPIILRRTNHIIPDVINRHSFPMTPLDPSSYKNESLPFSSLECPQSAAKSTQPLHAV